MRGNLAAPFFIVVVPYVVVIAFAASRAAIIFQFIIIVVVIIISSRGAPRANRLEIVILFIVVFAGNSCFSGNLFRGPPLDGRLFILATTAATTAAATLGTRRISFAFFPSDARGGRFGAILVIVSFIIAFTATDWLFAPPRVRRGFLAECITRFFPSDRGACYRLDFLIAATSATASAAAARATGFVVVFVCRRAAREILLLVGQRR